uniref:Transposase n=1 Tax=Leptobrachium leishanense TaxID=445787 RepID=A0A8C5QBU4_9ANUR
MVKSREWSRETREEVITLHRKGNGYKKIAKMLNIPRETIGSIIRKFKAKGTVETLPGRGRKKMLTSTAVRYLKRRVEKSPRVTAEELRKDLSDVGTEVSAQTIRRTLRNEGLHARTPRRTPLLSPKNKKSRLQYAKSHVDKPQKFWDSVLWTEETKLELFGPMDQRYVWRRKKKVSRFPDPTTQYLTPHTPQSPEATNRVAVKGLTTRGVVSRARIRNTEFRMVKWNSRVDIRAVA